MHQNAPGFKCPVDVDDGGKGELCKEKRRGKWITRQEE